MKVFRYIIVYLLIIQISLFYILPLSSIYNYRLYYDVVKDNTKNIDFILDKLSEEIEASNEDYIIILGDSVAFSGPGPATESIGYYLENVIKETGQKFKVYNLSMPAMQTGDIYTMLLKLEEKGIKTDRLIFNIIYAGFVERNPDPPPVFWLKEDLKRLDDKAYLYVYPALAANGYVEDNGILAIIKGALWDNIALLKYKDAVKLSIYKHLPILKNEVETLGDARPWYEKEGLAELLAEPQYLMGFSEKPFDMTENNPQIFFLNKILAYQQGKETLVFLGGTNDELMAEYVNKSGYKNNLAAIDHYFLAKEVNFINFQNVINDAYFTDHVHLTGDGYLEMAEIIYANFFEGE